MRTAAVATIEDTIVLFIVATKTDAVVHFIVALMRRENVSKCGTDPLADSMLNVEC
jgi:hypothetical protein